MSLSIPTPFPATCPATIEKIKIVEERIREREQTEFVTEHLFHAGLYCRTVRIPKGTVFTNTLIKIPTVVIIHGEIAISVTEDLWTECKGYNVCAGTAGRKQIYISVTDVEMTMIFPSLARTVEEAEAEFTDEAETLLSRTQENDIVVTETPCRE